jgi:hypothetical protein
MTNRSRDAVSARVFDRNVKQQRLPCVATGLDPVVHGDVPLAMRDPKVDCASLPHGLPGQARQ